jgi:hypothetical protein
MCITMAKQVSDASSIQSNPIQGRQPQRTFCSASRMAAGLCSTIACASAVSTVGSASLQRSLVWRPILVVFFGGGERGLRRGRER